MICISLCRIWTNKTKLFSQFNRSDVRTTRKSAKAMEQTGTKILVRNIPFQAKPAEVRDLFGAFGELKSLRIPKKMTPGEDSHRGFGFVDFNTKSDAKVRMSVQFIDRNKFIGNGLHYRKHLRHCATVRICMDVVWCWNGLPPMKGLMNYANEPLNTFRYHNQRPKEIRRECSMRAM